MQMTFEFKLHTSALSEQYKCTDCEVALQSLSAASMDTWSLLKCKAAG